MMAQTAPEILPREVTSTLPSIRLHFEGLFKQPAQTAGTPPNRPDTEVALHDFSRKTSPASDSFNRGDIMIPLLGSTSPRSDPSSPAGGDVSYSTFSAVSTPEPLSPQAPMPRPPAQLDLKNVLYFRDKHPQQLEINLGKQNQTQENTQTMSPTRRRSPAMTTRSRSPQKAEEHAPVHHAPTSASPIQFASAPSLTTMPVAPQIPYRIVAPPSISLQAIYHAQVQQASMGCPQQQVFVMVPTMAAPAPIMNSTFVGESAAELDVLELLTNGLGARDSKKRCFDVSGLSGSVSSAKKCKSEF